jgi:hypothetical protein
MKMSTKKRKYSMRTLQSLIFLYKNNQPVDLSITNEQLIEVIATFRKKDRPFADWLIKQIKPRKRCKVSRKNIKQLTHE